MKQPLRVEGVKEAQQAFASVARDATPGAVAAAAAEAILPNVAFYSRRASGAMAKGWGVESSDTEAYFVNDVEYWTYQEFGTSEIDPQYAIPRAWAHNETDIVKAAGEVVIEAGKDAGFEQ